MNTQVDAMETTHTNTELELLAELQDCRRDLQTALAALEQSKKYLRRCEVQIDSLKAENTELKNKFAKIENNPIGSRMLQVYRLVREYRRRHAG